MEVPACSYTFEVCAHQLTVVAYVSGLSVAALAYLVYLTRHASTDKRFVRIRLAVLGAIVAQWISTIVHHSVGGTVAVLSPLLAIAFTYSVTYGFARYVRNILEAVFETLQFSMSSFRRAVVRRLIQLSLLAHYGGFVVFTTIIIGLVTSGDQCPPWRVALQLYNMIMGFFLQVPITASCCALLCFLRTHVTEVEDTFHKSNDGTVIARAKRNLLKVFTVSFLAATVFAVASVIPLFQDDPYGNSGGCDAASHGIGFLTRFAIYFTLMRHTHKERKFRGKNIGSNSPITSRTPTSRTPETRCRVNSNETKSSSTVGDDKTSSVEVCNAYKGADSPSGTLRSVETANAASLPEETKGGEVLVREDQADSQSNSQKTSTPKHTEETMV